jgi:hypothetical protein
MPSWIVSRSCVILAFLVPAAIGAACNRSATDDPGRTTQTAAAPPTAPAVLTGATRAPGSERFGEDLHPERVDLSQVTKESIAQSITRYVQDETGRHGGVFAIDDPQQNTTLDLNLANVHMERLSALGDGRYFACADFKGRDGHTYDIDVFMRPHSEAGFVPTDVLVHKQDGKARFDWVERDGRWAQAPTTR